MQSMTGCGRCSVTEGTLTVTADLRSVNHRFLDVACRLPRSLAFLEDTVRRCCGNALRRGHVDVFLTVNDTAAPAVTVKADPALARAYARAAASLSEAAGVQNDLNVSGLMRLDGVLTVTDPEADEERLNFVRSVCEKAMNGALERLNEMRGREGQALEKDLEAHLSLVENLRRQIAERAPEVVTAYKTKLETRVRELLQGAEPDPARLAQEVAIMADRCAIDEELSRLASHAAQFRTYLKVQGETGKKIDFLIQEMNREANTIGSKASDAAIAQLVVDLKSEIEKLREQIQNVE